MENETEGKPGESLPKMGLLRGFFFALFGILRATAILATLAFVAAGGYLAYDLFNFFKLIVEEPAGIVREWQAVVEADQGELGATSMQPVRDDSLSAPQAPAADHGSATDNHVAGALTPEAPTLPGPAAAPVTPGEASATGDNAPIPSQSAGPDADEPVTASADEPNPPASEPNAAGVDLTENEGRVRRHAQRASQPPQDENPWVDLAGRALEALEAGSFNWFAGLALLVAFCWILGKIPALIITAGLKALVDLFKLGSERS